MAMVKSKTMMKQEINFHIPIPATRTSIQAYTEFGGATAAHGRTSSLPRWRAPRPQRRRPRGPSRSGSWRATRRIRTRGSRSAAPSTISRGSWPSTRGVAACCTDIWAATVRITYNAVSYTEKLGPSSSASCFSWCLLLRILLFVFFHLHALSHAQRMHASRPPRALFSWFSCVCSSSSLARGECTGSLARGPEAP